MIRQTRKKKALVLPEVEEIASFRLKSALGESAEAGPPVPDPEAINDPEAPALILDELVDPLEGASPELGSNAAAIIDPVPANRSEITIEKAAERLSPEILRALEEHFKGSLVKVRAPDERDLLF